MKTVQFKVEDNKLDKFLTVINNLKDDLFEDFIVKNYSELDDDTIEYMKTEQFKDDKIFFQKSLDDIKSGKTKALSHDDVWKQIDNHTQAS